MAALAWLIIPFVAAVAAAFWGRWAARNRSTRDGASLAGYERFRVAMEAPGGDVARAVPPVLAGGSDMGPAAGRAAEAAGPLAGDEDSPRGPVVGPVP